MIYTLTLNPCIDKMYYINDLEIGAVNKAYHSRTDLSGKGINVSLDLSVMGMKSMAFGFMGAESAESYIRYLDSYNICSSFTVFEGATRTNTKVMDTVSGIQTDFNEAGSSVTEKGKAELHNRLLETVKPGDLVVISGSVPPGYTFEDFTYLFRGLTERGARVSVDTEGERLRYAVDNGAFMIKPNIHELEQLYGKAAVERKGLAAVAREIGKTVENVIISLGEDGAVFCRDDKVLHAKVRGAECVSTTGAGDALHSGFIFALESGMDFMRCIDMAMAAATAKICFEGTKPPTLEIIEKFKGKAEIKILE